MKALLSILIFLSGVVLGQAQRVFYPPKTSCGNPGFLYIDDQTTAFSENIGFPNSDFPTPNLCFGVGAPHNLGWYRFITKSSGPVNFTLQFEQNSCELAQGIQAGIMGDCTGKDVLDCNASCNVSSFSLTFVSRPMEDYFLWIDGCNGDVCEYEFQITGVDLCEEGGELPVRINYYSDENDNCTYEQNEKPLLRCKTKFTSSFGGETYSMSSGSQGFAYLPDGLYNVSTSHDIFDELDFCPDAFQLDVNPGWTNRLLDIGANFPNDCRYLDFNIIPPFGANRFRCDPSKRKTLLIEYHNLGMASTENDDFIVKHSPFMTQVDFDLPHTKIDDYTYRIDIPELSGSGIAMLSMTYILDCTAQDLGKDVCIEVYEDDLTCPELTSTLAREVYCSPIILAYDPNDILVRPSGFTQNKYIEKTDELEYRIRFQNEGTDTAYNIIIDLETARFDPQTVIMGYSSHNTVAKYQLFPDDKMRFYLNDINLVDSKTNEPESHGYIKFKLKLHEPVELDRIEHFANIFFDFNPPIQTNIDFHTIAPPYFEQVNEVHLCPEQEYMGQTFVRDTILTDTVALDGPDSLYVTKIFVHEAYYFLFDTLVSPGDSILGVPIDTDTFIQRNFFTQWDCDSIIVYEVSVKNTTSLINGYDKAVSIYPNPMTGSSITITHDLPGQEHILTLYDLSGKIILSSVLTEKEQTVALTGLSKSNTVLYRITDRGGAAIESGKLIYIK